MGAFGFLNSFVIVQCFIFFSRPEQILIFNFSELLSNFHLFRYFSNWTNNCLVKLFVKWNCLLGKRSCFPKVVMKNRSFRKINYCFLKSLSEKNRSFEVKYDSFFSSSLKIIVRLVKKKHYSCFKVR